MSAQPPAIRFLFDFISPYAYLGWTQIHSLAERHRTTVEPVPVLFAALLNAHGHKGPAEIPPKRIYVFKDALRSAHRLGLPLVPPPSHPFNPLLGLRAASLDLPVDRRRALIDALFQATWAGGGGIDDAQKVAAAAAKAGLDGAEIVALASAEPAKARLRKQTEEALAQGVFGVPTMLVGEELFWGFDSFDHLEMHLRGEDPVAPAALLQWATLGASASRI